MFNFLNQMQDACHLHNAFMYCSRILGLEILLTFVKIFKDNDQWQAQYTQNESKQKLRKQLGKAFVLTTHS